MTVLLALSILAFIALFWAAISIFGAVRRARRRRTREATNVAATRNDALSASPRQVVYPDPEAAPTQAPPPPLVDAPPPPPPPGLRNFPTRIGKHTLAATNADGSWAKWNPFGTDYADLTDPAPSRRSPKAGDRNKDRKR